MTSASLQTTYKLYIDLLNARRFGELGQYVNSEISYNDEQITLADYQQLFENNVRLIPDLKFEVQLLFTEGDTLGCRLYFDCTPTGEFLGLPVNGANVKFHENVFYQFAGGKIKSVWSVIDKPAIERQIAANAA